MVSMLPMRVLLAPAPRTDGAGGRNGVGGMGGRTPGLTAYFFLNKASKAARGSRGPAGAAARRPVASRAVCGVNWAQSLRVFLDRTGAGRLWRHSHRAEGSK